MKVDGDYRSQARMRLVAIESGERLGLGVRRALPAVGDAYLLLHMRTDAVVQIGNRRQGLTASGCLLLTPGRTGWVGGAIGGLTFDMLALAGPGAAAAVEHSGLPANEVFYPWALNYLSDTVEVLYRERAEEQAGWDHVVAAQAELLLLHLRRGLAGPGPQRVSPLAVERLRHVHALRRRHPEHPWTLEMLAREASFSRSRFSALYQRTFGVSPIEHLIRVRIERARQLLQQGRHTVGQVAALCGFDHLSYFTRAFRRRVGCTPREYR